MWLIALAPLLAMMAEVLLYAALARATGRILASLGMGIAAGAGVLALALMKGAPPAALPEDIWGWGIAAAGSFLAFTFCFWATINLNATSIRIRILREIAASPGKSLPLATLTSRYSEAAMIEARLDRLVALGHLAVENGVARVVKPTLPRIAAAVALVRRILIPQNEMWPRQR
ncbi:MAG: hypothetical protein AB7M12_09760 [Hyphomonadaceae bacterium]